MAVDDAGTLYAADSNNRIQKFDSKGRFLTTWGRSGPTHCRYNFPTSVAVDSSGNVFVTDGSNGELQKFALLR